MKAEPGNYDQPLTPTPPERQKLQRAIWVVGIFTAVLILIVGIDHLTIGRPVQSALAADPRNDGFRLSVHRQYRVVPRVLVINLQEVTGAAPIDLMRGIFISAETLHQSGVMFDQVLLSRRGTPVFMLPGDDFAAIGAEYGAGQNPLYLVRTLPEKLHTPDGAPAYGTWSGGMLGVLGQQMQDVSASMNRWVGSE